MDSLYVAKQLEFYSNAIVSFMVLQALAFCYSFGTNEMFNKTLKTKKELSVILAVHFFVITITALLANYFLQIKLEEISGEFRELVKLLYLGKAFAIGIFGALPLFVIVRYALFGPPSA